MQIASLRAGCAASLCHLLTDLLWPCEVKANEAGRSHLIEQMSFRTMHFLIMFPYINGEIEQPLFLKFVPYK